MDLTDPSKGKSKDAKSNQSPQKATQPNSSKNKVFIPNTNFQKRQTLKTSKNNLMIDPVDLFSYKKKQFNIICSFQNKNQNIDNFLNYNQITDYYMLTHDQDNRSQARMLDASPNQNTSTVQDHSPISEPVPNVNNYGSQSSIYNGQKQDKKPSETIPFHENILFMAGDEQNIRKGS